MSAPSVDPLLNTPMAKARLSKGTFSLTAFTPPGQFALSASPSRKRSAPKLTTPAAKLCPMVTADQNAT